MTSAPFAAGPAAPLMLSVSGARGIVGQTMTPAVAADFAAAFGSFIRSRNPAAHPLLCVGRDGRPSGAELAAAAITGLLKVGCRAVDLGVTATPSVAVMIGVHGAAGGLVVTASHNPTEWNGLKCLNADGVAPPPADAAEIIQRFRSSEFLDADPLSADSVTRDDRANEVHVQRVLEQVDVPAIRAARFRVVLDSINGAGCVSGRMLLEALGCALVHVNSEPHGRFAHPPEPTETNLQELTAQVQQARAACGFAQDPDADRLAILDQTGRYIGEEYTLVLAAERVLQREATRRRSASTQHPALSTTAAELILAANLSTSRMIDDVAARYPGVRVLRTAVGEANVVAALKPHGPRAILGGEGNGGVILPAVCWVRDSLSAMALVLELLAVEKRPLSQIIAALPRYAMIKRKLDLESIGGVAALAPALERVLARFRGERINMIDGVRIDLADGWVHLRPSNTEPIVRLIAEAGTAVRAQALIDQVAAVAGLSATP